MKKILIIISLVSLFSCKKEEPIAINNSSWIEDIEYIQTQLPNCHIDLFSKISQADFDIQIENLVNEVPELEENEIICKIMKIFAQVGDSHTGIHNQENLSNFTLAHVNFSVFDDGVFITGFLEGYDEYLMKEVIAINGFTIEDIFDSIATVMPHENDYLVKSAFPNFLRLYQILEALDIISSQNSYVLSLANGTDLRLKTNSNTYTLTSCYSSENTPLYLQNNEENYWYQLIDENIVYLQYNQCVEMSYLSFDDFNQQLFDEISDLQIDKFIIDLRLNTGGSSTIIAPLIEVLKKRDNMEGNLYVCIGNSTYSSGLLNAIELKEDLGAILVGEPTGGKPNCYGEVQELILPNTELLVKYSTKEFTIYSDSDPITLEPDFYIENLSDNSFKGIDSCIEFIKSK